MSHFNSIHKNVSDLTNYILRLGGAILDETDDWMTLEVLLSRQEDDEASQVEVTLNTRYGGMEVKIAVGCYVGCCGISLGKTEEGTIEKFKELVQNKMGLIDEENIWQSTSNGYKK